MKRWHEIKSRFIKYSGKNVHYNPTLHPTSCMAGNTAVNFFFFICYQTALRQFVQGVFGTSLQSHVLEQHCDETIVDASAISCKVYEPYALHQNPLGKVNHSVEKEYVSAALE